MVERVLCKHEVVGSIPSGSTKLRDRVETTEFQLDASAFSWFDIVNEGSTRPPQALRVDPEKTSLSGKDKYQSACVGVDQLLRRLVRKLTPTHEFC